MDYESWCSLSDEELGQRDIAEANLAIAFGLPYADSLDISALRSKLDGWTDFVRGVTERVLL